jgi:acyl-CoA thioester hydrolase
MKNEKLEQFLKSSENKIQVRVSFLDCDGMNVVRFPLYQNYAEAGLIELLRSLGFEPGKEYLERNIAFPVRELTCKYHKSGRFDEILTVISHITSAGSSSIVISGNVFRQDVLLMECTSVRVCLNVKTGQKVSLEEAFKHLFDRV